MNTYQFTIYRKLTHALRWLVIGCSFVFSCQVAANELSINASSQLDNWDRVSNSELEQLRGGFELPSGMNIDFSIARMIFLNGEVISSSSFQLPSNVSFLQTGIMNQFLNSTDSGLSPMIIQNHMDNQVIKTITDINIGLSHLQHLTANNSRLFLDNYIQPQWK